MNLHWICPKCKTQVDFYSQLMYVFDEETKVADFDPKYGLMFHTIDCTCGATWVMSIGGMSLDECE